MATIEKQTNDDRMGGYWRDRYDGHAEDWAIDCTVYYQTPVGKSQRRYTFFLAGTLKREWLKTILADKADKIGVSRVLVHKIHEPMTPEEMKYIDDFNEVPLRLREDG